MSLIRQFILQDPDDNTRLGEFDTKFKVPVHISVEHHEIHEGDSHEVHINSANLLVGTMNIAFKTLDSAKLAHMLFGWSSSDEILFEIIEGPTWDTDSGTVTQLHNHERDIGGASEVILEDDTATPTFTATDQVLKDVTTVAGGTVIDSQYTYNSGFGASTVAETRTAGHEWDLKRDTTYVIRMTGTNGGTNTAKMTIDLHWYEHTNE